ncbi:sigma-70 family RNA polymerase sigma factor [Nocardioides cavernae]|uniref:Sigma-70 family RNA polymerase sigma factor n=1 Tax=Nocardioides cavernae TaxID=1921566 RepID=A0ABR8N8L1_9ACTN|nr:sigma-70 family RNA polymerase sigma factor [Nocardioides cavernae]MBD3923917.1 sigma-70 family RNA polymerase sigma factor [Nocardioides cavernae]MBM7511147.1 RNA polymerase sigma-70 factor (ECF subfamily) [Nocardioides cavernae]
MGQVAEVAAPDVAEPAPGTAVAMGHEGFADFYRAELPGLVALARGLCGSVVADDIAQEAMLAAYRRWSEVEGFDQPQAWVRRTCANLAISSFRRRMVEVRALARMTARSAPAPLDEDAEEFWTAVRSLPRRQAQCAALRYVYEMGGAEIGRTLSITEGSVKVHLARARTTLAARLELVVER